MNKAGIIKHRLVFEQWLEGKQIQVRGQGHNRWVINSDPDWCSCNEYRVKPESVKVKVAMFRSKSGLILYLDKDVSVSDPQVWSRISDWVEIEVKEDA